MEKKLAAKLKLLRKSYGYTQTDAAVWIGQDRSNLSKKENGIVPFTIGEFFTVYMELRRRGPKKKKKEIISIDDFLADL